MTTPIPEPRPSAAVVTAAREAAKRARQADSMHAGTVGQRIERAAYRAYLEAVTPAPCVMTHTPPMDFAQCETHDETFRLGEECRFNGRDAAEVFAEEADQQRQRAVVAEMRLADLAPITPSSARPRETYTEDVTALGRFRQSHAALARDCTGPDSCRDEHREQIANVDAALALIAWSNHVALPDPVVALVDRIVEEARRV